MKRVSFLLASLAAILLLSCGSDNLTSTAEDVSYPKAPALKKVVPVDEVQIPFLPLKKASPNDEAQGSSDPGQSTINTNGSKRVYCGSMSITIPYLPYPQEGWSSDAVCDFRSLPAGSTNVEYKIEFGGYSNIAGTFSISHLLIECGNYWALYNWSGNLTTEYTEDFKNTPADVVCYLNFYGRCNGTALGGGPCKFTINNIYMTSFYQY